MIHACLGAMSLLYSRSIAPHQHPSAVQLKHHSQACMYQGSRCDAVASIEGSLCVGWGLSVLSCYDGQLPACMGCAIVVEGWRSC